MEKDTVYLLVGRNTVGHGFEPGSLVIGTGKPAYNKNTYWFVGLRSKGTYTIDQVLKPSNVFEIGKL